MLKAIIINIIISIIKYTGLGLSRQWKGCMQNLRPERKVIVGERCSACNSQCQRKHFTRTNYQPHYLYTVKLFCLHEVCALEADNDIN